MKKLTIILTILLSIFILSCDLDSKNKDENKTDLTDKDDDNNNTNNGGNQTDGLIARTLYLVGDSTVSSFDDTAYYYPRAGYGTAIGNYLNSDKITVSNLALSGRSSKSFLIEENYNTLSNSISEGDILMIGFGHNDEKAEEARYTNPNGAIDEPTSFKYSLYENYIKLAQEKGASVILCTPIVRRSSSDDYTGGVIHQTTTSGDYAGGDYSQAIRDLGEELGLPVIDNTTNTKTLYETLTASETLYLHAWTSSSDASVDNTHTNSYGAAYIAYLIATDLKESETVLADYVNDDISAPLKSSLTSNPLYVEVDYTAPTEMSTIWTTTDPWYGTVFGDCGGASKIGTDYYTISETAEGVTMRSGTLDSSAGKIASSSDGLAMYFQKLDSSTDFTLSATATIQSITSNNQVSFGLMVRDAMWIDTFDAALKSAYVTAGPLSITTDAFYTSFTREFDVATETTNLNREAVATNMSIPVADAVIDLTIVKSGADYTVTYGTEDPVTYTIDLAAMDSDFVYAGLYTARQCEVDFSNIQLTITE